ncbi:MAG TPA: choloylglycine hydrolase family protein [Candidatus Enterenecus stercoripullorum]|nr:choloylglycine hydrolase family protein [Candidatus Enterenecus stercoripullorum]
MCTAISFVQGDHYFGRTLDLDRSLGEQVVVTPRDYPLRFRMAGELPRHQAIIGMALVQEGYPLYYEGVNETGLAMAGLNFPGNAQYGTAVEGRDNVASFEFIPWILGQCHSVDQALGLLARINLTNTPFRGDLPPAPLHWMIADGKQALVAECGQEGLKLYPDPARVLTNNPPFPFQIYHLKRYLNLTREEPENRFAPGLDLTPDCLGMGAVGLPGDLSSSSRFVRAAFARANALPGETEEERVTQFFHVLDTVDQTKGLARAGQGGFERTVYTCCCNASRGIYYYTTYDNCQITAVRLDQADLEGDGLAVWPLRNRQQICWEGRAQSVGGQ